MYHDCLGIVRPFPASDSGSGWDSNSSVHVMIIATAELVMAHKLQGTGLYMRSIRVRRSETPRSSVSWKGTHRLVEMMAHCEFAVCTSETPGTDSR